LPQPKLTPATLQNAIQTLESNYPKFRLSAQKFKNNIPLNSAAKFYKLIKKFSKWYEAHP
jgi:hypothetical protein